MSECGYRKVMGDGRLKISSHVPNMFGTCATIPVLL
jgi:hypothetical protein